MNKNLLLVFLLAFNFSALSQDIPMYKIEPVNLDIADSLKDYEFTSRVFTNIILSFDKNSNDLKSQLSNKTIPEQTVYFATKLDMQVLNGGIYQYFGNYGNEYDMEIISALQKLGLLDLSSMFEQMSKLASKEYSEVKSKYDEFDRFYYKMSQKNSMDSHLKEFIIKHINIFKTQ